MQRIYSSRRLGLLIILFVYILAVFIGLTVFRLTAPWELYIRLFAADLAATVFTWLMSVLFGNSSVYDPYWSVAPIVLVPLTGIYLGRSGAGFILIAGAVLIWGVRLTAHWCATFQNLGVQDWRYTQLKEARRRLWLLVNLFGIHVFPTVVVFLALMPAVVFLQNGAPVNPGTVAAALVCLFAAALQHIADRQMRAFRLSPENAGRVNRAGVWKVSRHPNYLGEILMWWGVYLMMLFSGPSRLVFIAGPAVNTLMFIFISIPMLERRQLMRRPDYAAYRAETGMLLPKLSSFGSREEKLKK
jgi:steroid 5-alpha reductase family enzyme